MARINLTDLAHRTFWTFIQSFLSLIVATQVIDLATLHASAIAAGAAALVPVKEYARAQLSS
jgi:hypothetical protein